MSTCKIVNAFLVNEGATEEYDVLIDGQYISRIDKDLSGVPADTVIDAEGQHLLPGVIDDQVHFREPGLTRKADIFTESRAAVAGGVTSFMEMPNTNPQTLTQDLLTEKYQIGAAKALANYSFYMGVSNDNIEEVLKTDPNTVCGLKIFMGSSTGNMLVDNETVLNNVFSQASLLIATHCEDEAIIRANTTKYRKQYGENMPIRYHPEVRSEEACYKSSTLAVALAKEHNTRLHILHISTGKEVGQFDSRTPLTEKRITSEACIHHMWFNDNDYNEKGTLIKWNPAVKKESDRKAILQGVLDNAIDVIATDHAPHTLAEKQQGYFSAPSGGPLIQHGLPAMLELSRKGEIPLERVVEKMCHNPAVMFHVSKRGFIREGYFADLVLVNLNKPWTVDNGSLLYKCGWSPFEGVTFHAQVTHTWVSGHLAYANGMINDSQLGMRLTFDRK